MKRRIVNILENENILTKEDAKIFSDLINYRNQIAHEYENISAPEIKWCLNHLTFIKNFMKIVKNKLL